MAQQAKALASKPDNLYSVPRTHVVKENQLPARFPLTSTHACVPPP